MNQYLPKPWVGYLFRQGRLLNGSRTFGTSARMLLVLALMHSARLVGQPQPPTNAAHADLPSIPASTTLSPTAARADFDVMRKALEEAHSGLYRYASRSSMDRTFARDRQRLKKELTTTEFMAALSQTLAAIKCGHTSIQPDDALRAAVGEARLFPLQVHLEGGRLFAVTNELENDRSIRPGMEILEINRRKASSIIEKMYAVQTGDGDVETIKKTRTQRGFPLYYWLLIDQSQRFSVKARDRNGTIVSTQLPGIRASERKGSQNQVNAEWLAGNAKLNWARQNLAVRFMNGHEVAQIRIGSFSGADYPGWLESTFKDLAEKGTKSLIIDVRGNGGGDDMYGAMLVSYLTDKPFRYFDRIVMKTIVPSAFLSANSEWKAGSAELLAGTSPNPGGGLLLKASMHRGLAQQPPARYPFGGKVIVLIDGGTFSTAADFCAVTHHLKRATFVGEETGGGYQGNTSGMQTMVTLPNSQFRLRLPMHEYWNAVSPGINNRRGTRPDYPVSNRWQELLAGADAQANFAIRLAGLTPE